MKKEIVLLALSFILFISIVSAVEIKLSKDSYKPMETLQAEITGNFIDSLAEENILIYKIGIPRSTPVLSGFAKHSDTYYFYAILPNQEGNFSINIENARYTESGAEKTETITKEFKIKTKNESALQINPGLVKTSGDFSVDIKNLYEGGKISADFNGQASNFSLNEGAEKTIEFSVMNMDSGKYDLKINSYIIPVFVTEKTIINDTPINQTNQTNINQTNSTQPKVNITNKTEDEVKAMNCSDFGKECGDNEQCDVETKPALDSGFCCPGACTEKKKTSYTWLGILIILIVLGAVAFIYFKAKNKEPPTSEEILRSKSDKFDERMENREVSGKLGGI
ncbi:MAG: hypothetical protein PHH54_02970 [Candidatus Nanoarchaeia archaeon]|nr:hypothetical protein [Candidatus Nanoarchaeia archaeon]MDD5740922.1 hypothetical protein [Candidatus Nanoarchaeia archaeon]